MYWKFGPNQNVGAAARFPGCCFYDDKIPAGARGKFPPNKMADTPKLCGGKSYETPKMGTDRRG